MDAVAIVDRLLASVPAASCVGLTEVVLTTAGTPSRGRRRGRLSVHGRRRRTRHVLALYHGSGPAGPAWIEVFVDRILAGVPRVVLRMPPARDLLFAWVVFHELGHHVHQHVGSAPGDPETVADDWAAQFTVMFIHQRYPYLVPLLSVVRWCSRAGKAFARLRARARRKR